MEETTISELYIELRIYEIFNSQKIRDLYEQHKEPWERLFKYFIKKHLEVMLDPNVNIPTGGSVLSDSGSSDTSQRGRNILSIGRPIRRFPLQSNGKLRWYGKNIYPFFDIIPVAAKSSEGIELVQNTRFILTFENIENTNITISIFSSKWVDVAKDHNEIENHDDDDLLTNSFFVLSCFLQYSPVVFGPYSKDSILCVRPLLILLLLKRLVPSNNSDSRIWLDLDMSVMNSFLEEWLVVPGHNSVGHEGHSGRSTGALIFGPQGIGKSMFCFEFLKILSEIIPWMLVDSPPPPLNDIPVKFEKGGIILDGAWLVSESSVYKSADDLASAPSLQSDETARIGHRPLLHGESSPDKTSPQAIKRVQEVFSWLKNWMGSVKDKMVMIVIERMDVIIASRQARSVLSQFKWEMENTCKNDDIFCIGTCRDYLVPALDRVDRNRNERYLTGFRIIKVFPCSLDVKFQYIIDSVKRKSKSILNGVRSNGCFHENSLEHPARNLTKGSVLGRKIIKLIEVAEKNELFLEKKDEWHLLLHNMNSSDVDKISLSFQIYLSKNMHCCAYKIDQNKSEVAKLVIEAMDYTLNSPSLLNLLSPKHLSSRMFVRHEFVTKSDVQNIAQEIFTRANDDYQYIHFIKLVTPDSEKEENLYGNLKIHQSDIQPLLHHLHKLFKFRSSISINSPEYIVPFHPRLSSNHPMAALNPFDSFLWHNRQSCIILNTLDQCVGFKLHPSRTYTTETKTTNKNTVGTFHSSDIKDEFGIMIRTKASATVSNHNSEGSLTGIRTKIQRTAKTAAKYHFPVSIGVDVGTSRGWDRERHTGTSFGKSISHGVNFVPKVSFRSKRYCTHTYGNRNFHGNEQSSAEKLINSETRSFEHQEALTRLIIGMKSFIDRPAKVVEKLNNLVIVLYNSDDCFHEVAIQRLGIPKVYVAPQRRCEHFRNHVRIKAECCGMWFRCFMCHDIVSDHKMTKINSIECLNCFQTSRSSIVCGCGEMFGKFSCGTCGVYRDDCSSDAFVHCLVCDSCYASDYIEYHMSIKHPKKGR